MSALLDRYNLLLDQLNLPLNLKSISLATPTLLLSTLEAILGTRIIDVPTAWRTRTDVESRRKVVTVLLRAIDEVTEGIRARAGECTAKLANDCDAEAITVGDERVVAAVAQSLLDIAQALDVFENRARRTGSDGRVAVVGLAESNEASSPEPPVSPRKLFSPRPLRRQGPMPTSPSRPRTALSNSPLHPAVRYPNPSARPPSTTVSEPAPPEHVDRGPLFSTPTRRQRPPASFLAELARVSSPRVSTSPSREPTSLIATRAENGATRASVADSVELYTDSQSIFENPGEKDLFARRSWTRRMR
ncbi:hypothetical protein BMF94_3889 [Rhodotorula taiwanensis]|uniref:Uncharacterized protein n=1 Tax=Rhodotorula taiwanensis TaxID=741276 RepID=A0A2S5B8K9_9BASI|nr:hypothetical protein BMF94_3889 [Rhodotorula taiwanensis]